MSGQSLYTSIGLWLSLLAVQNGPAPDLSAGKARSVARLSKYTWPCFEPLPNRRYMIWDTTKGLLHSLTVDPAKPSLRASESQRPISPIMGTPSGVRISPDGRQMAWVEAQRASSAEIWRVVSTTGGQDVHGKLERGYIHRHETGWLKDRIALLTDSPVQPTLQIYSRSNLNGSVTSVRLDWSPSKTYNVPMIAGTDGQSIVVVGRISPTSRNSLEVQSVNMNGVQIQYSQVNLPAGRRVHEFTASSDAKQLALFAQNKNHEELWIAPVKGTTPRLVGYFKLPGKRDYRLDETSRPYALRWSPDGLRLAYIYRQRLYDVEISPTQHP